MVVTLLIWFILKCTYHIIKVIEDLFYDIIKKQFDNILHMYRYNKLFFNFFAIYYSLYFKKCVKMT